MQRGQIYKHHGAWFVRFYEGKRRITKRLGAVEEYPTKRSVESLAQDVIRKVNQSSAPGITLDSFVETVFLPYAKELRASTYRGYEGIWRTYIRGRDEAQLRVREYRTIDVQALLNAVAEESVLSVATLQHFKSYLSGVFRYAAQAGIREGNPVTECRIPKNCKPANETYAYSLVEIRTALNSLDILPKAAVAVAAFAGLRLAEIHGLEWADYDGETLSISRSVWRGHSNETKSKASRDYVPVIPPLRSILDAYRQTLGDPKVGPVFPMDLENVGRTIIRNAMNRVELKWRGWHAFRRGLASNLFELGCDDITVQRVLRHAKVTVTRAHYIKIRDAKLEAAMQSLSDAYGHQIGTKLPNGSVN